MVCFQIYFLYILFWNFRWHLKNIYLFICIHWVLVVARGIFSVCGGIWTLQLWHVGSSSLTRNQTRSPALGAGVLATRNIKEVPSAVFWHPLPHLASPEIGHEILFLTHLKSVHIDYMKLYCSTCQHWLWFMQWRFCVNLYFPLLHCHLILDPQVFASHHPFLNVPPILHTALPSPFMASVVVRIGVRRRNGVNCWQVLWNIFKMLWPIWRSGS